MGNGETRKFSPLDVRDMIVDLAGYTASEKVILHTIARHANYETYGNAYPGVDTIALNNRLARRTVMRSFHDLEEKEVIILEKEHGYRDNRRYRLNVELLHKQLLEQIERRKQEKQQKKGIPAKEGVNGRYHGQPPSELRAEVRREKAEEKRRKQHEASKEN